MEFFFGFFFFDFFLDFFLEFCSWNCFLDFFDFFILFYFLGEGGGLGIFFWEDCFWVFWGLDFFWGDFSGGDFFGFFFWFFFLFFWGFFFFKFFLDWFLGFFGICFWIFGFFFFLRFLNFFCVGDFFCGRIFLWGIFFCGGFFAGFFVTRSAETVDQAHRPQAGTHEGEDTRGKDRLFLSDATDPQHVRAVLNRLEPDAAFSAMSVNRVETRLVGACEAFRTRLNEMRAVQNTVSDTPKASSANAERIERASQIIEKRPRTSRPWFEGMTVERVCKVMPDTVRNCAWKTSRHLARPGRAKQNEASRRHNGHLPRRHWKCMLVRVCRCRIGWRRPENQRWDR